MQNILAKTGWALFVTLLASGSTQDKEKIESNYIISFQCAEVINIALIDLKRSLSYKVQKKLEIASCTISEGKARVEFYPSNPEIRGGGLIYIIDVLSSEVIEKVGLR